MYFKDIAIGQNFTCNGAVYQKKSTRTAVINMPEATYHGEWFYFGQMEWCIVIDNN